MSTAEIKSAINQYLDKVEDEKFLKVVHAMLDTYVTQQSDIVGYSVTGQPITIEEANEKYQKGFDAHQRGESYTLEQIKEESKSWLKDTK